MTDAELKLLQLPLNADECAALVGSLSEFPEHKMAVRRLVFEVERLRAEPKMFPIQKQRGAEPHPMQVPWDVAELAYSVYAGKYGTSQSLERLAERGGFGPGEMDMFLPGWRDRCSRLAQLTEENGKLRTALSQYDLCHCGHFRSAHGGHGHRIGTVEPTHCSHGCGCQEFGFYYPAGGVDFPDEFASQLRELHVEPEGE